MDRKALLAIALSFVVLFGSNLLFQKLGWIPNPSQPKPTNEVKVQNRPSAAPGAAQIAEPHPAPGAIPSTTAAPSGQAASTWAPSPDTVLTVDRPHYSARIRSRGGRLVSIVLKDYKDGDSGRATLAADPLVALDLGDAQTPASLADVPFTWADSTDAEGRIARVTFTARDSSGLVIEQTYRFEDDDRIASAVAVTGLDPKLDVRRYRITLRSWPLLTERNRLEDLNNLGVTAKVGKDNKREM